MPSDIHLFEAFNHNRVFVETGTCVGEGVVSAILAGYSTIYSIELSQKYYDHSKELFKNLPWVHIVFGDSSIVLPQIMDEITAPATFWLDAHYSGGDSVQGEVFSPIMEELEAIKNHYIKEHVIIIDDIRLFNGSDPNVAFTVDDIKRKILEINKYYTFAFVNGHELNDMLTAQVVLPNIE